MGTHTHGGMKASTATTRVNGAEIYHDIRGNGPPIFFVQGTTGDGGSFAGVADLLADEFTVVTYHRRGNSLSPRPDGWISTSVDEQADDLAALIKALKRAPAIVFGTSDGATILVNLLIRHPEVLRGAIVHEPLLEPVIADAGEAREALNQFWATVEQALETAGPRDAMELIIRAVAGDANFERRDPAFRERLLGNADVYFSIEMEAFDAYMPDADDLAKVTVPTMVAAGEIDVLGGSLRETCAWVAKGLGTQVHEFPGAHTPYIDQPVAMVDAMRPFLREVSGIVQRSHSASDRSTEQHPLLYEQSGEGEPIVLVPGGLSGWVSWIPHAQRLSADRHVVRVQLRSIELVEAGLPIPETYSTATETDGLRATVDALGLDRFDLAGWSHGGHVALAFALAYPERVRTLTLIEPAAMWILRETGYSPSALGRLELQDRSLSGRTVTVENLKDFLVRAGFGQRVDDFESLPCWPVWVQNRQVLSIIGTIWDYENSLDALRNLDVPILAIQGSETTDDAIAIAEAIAASAPNAARLVLPGEHACHIESIDLFLDALQEHLAGAAAVRN